MPVPDYQSLMLPLLQFVEDGKDHTLAQAAEIIANKWGLSEEERNEMLPSGGQQKLFNRVGWARTYMVKAGLLESSGRGKFKITDRGLAALEKKPAKGVFITTSQFSADAKDYVNRIEKKIILIDGEQLANLSIEFGIGVAPVISYKIQRIDLDYFEEE